MCSLLAAASLLTSLLATPIQQHVFQPSQSSEFNVFQHLAAISPYWESSHPEGHVVDQCAITRAVILMRHSSITANDDEVEETIGPFTKALRVHRSAFANAGPLKFLEKWESPITDDNQEQITEPGKKDAYKLGKALAKRYEHLLPKKNGKHKRRFHVYTASSDRDIVSAKAFMKGLVPGHTNSDGTGDREVKLIEVPNKNVSWAQSLVPHKQCERFSKDTGKHERDAFQQKYTRDIVDQFNKLAPGFDFTCSDVIAMQQLCGYETVITGKPSTFCDLFSEEDWLNFEYSQDLYYHHMLGHRHPWHGALGVPWLAVAANKLVGPKAVHKLPKKLVDLVGINAIAEPSKTTALPKPTAAPNDTVTQDVNVYFTHREEPPVILAALGLFKVENDEMPVDRINPDRQWKTSEIISFCGHVNIERLQCESDTSKAWIRVLVNSVHKPLPDCNDGPGGTCELYKFVKLIEGLEGKYGKIEEVCSLPKDS